MKSKLLNTKIMLAALMGAKTMRTEQPSARDNASLHSQLWNKRRHPAADAEPAYKSITAQLL